MTTYLDFLKVLLKLGPKIPQAVALIEHIISDVQELIALVSGAPLMGSGGEMFVSADEAALEADVAEYFESAEPVYGAGPLQILRDIYDFLQKNPQVAELILLILKVL